LADLGGMPKPTRWAVTDAQRRVATDFGLVHDSNSYTLSPGERAVGTPGPQRQLLDSRATDGHEAVKQLIGPVDRVSASSYGSWLLQMPFVAPGNAFDGDSRTAWVDGAHDSSIGQWVQADYRRPIDPANIQVRLLEDGPWRPRVTALSVESESGAVVSPVRPDESLQEIAVPQGPTRRLRIGFAAVTNETPGGATAGLREVTVVARRPGLSTAGAIPSAQPWIRVPEEGSQLSAWAGAGRLPAVAFSRLNANPLDVLRRDEEPQLLRTFETPLASRMRIAATAIPARGRRLDELLTPPGRIEVTTSSNWNDLPQYRAANLVDGSIRTSWVAAPMRPQSARAPGVPGLRGFGASSARRSLISPAPIETDAHPVIGLRWEGDRVLSRLRVVPAGSFAARPLRIRLDTRGSSRNLRVPQSGVVRFPPLRTDQVLVSFPRVARRYTTTGFSDDPRERLPVGLRELDFPALRDLRLYSLLPGARIRIPCGDGPPITVDGRRLSTSLSATAGELVRLRSVPVRVCSPTRSVRLAAGVHRLRSRPGSAFTLTSLALKPLGWGPSGGSAKARRVRIGRWDDQHRTVEVGPGAPAYLAIRENFNSGWRATLGGRRLRPVRLDGWQQGFVLPGGAGGTVDLRFTPGGGYSVAMMGGAVLALALLALVLLPPSRQRDEGGPLRTAAPLRRGVLFTLTGVAVALVSLPALPAALAACLLARRSPPLLPWAASICVVTAAAIVVIDPDPHPLDRAAAFGAPAQVLSAAALAFLLASLIPPAARRSNAD
jgi:arabinofuranan 3-O-arabinosyltransferase